MRIHNLFVSTLLTHHSVMSLQEGKDKQMLVAKLNKLQNEGRQGLSTREKQRQAQNTLVKQQSVSHAVNTDVPLPVEPANVSNIHCVSNAALLVHLPASQCISYTFYISAPRGETTPQLTSHTLRFFECLVVTVTFPKTQ